MGKARKVLLVPHGKQGASHDAVVHNLALFSAVLSAFAAVMVRKYPDLKNEMLSVLMEMRDTPGVSTQDRAALSDAVEMVHALVTEDVLTH
jgi:hypothetical protein